MKGLFLEVEVEVGGTGIVVGGARVITVGRVDLGVAGILGTVVGGRGITIPGLAHGGRGPVAPRGARRVDGRGFLGGTKFHRTGQ